MFLCLTVLHLDLYHYLHALDNTHLRGANPMYCPIAVWIEGSATIFRGAGQYVTHFAGLGN